MYSFNFYLRRHIIWGKGGRVRVAPKAASNRYPYLFSSYSRAQIYLPYILDASAYHLGNSGSLQSHPPRYAGPLSRFQKGYPLFIIIFLNL